jgi:hypothetical protein
MAADKSEKDELLFRIESSYFTAGFSARTQTQTREDSSESKDLIVILAAPIIKYMTGWNVKRVEAYCERKGWALREVNANEKGI